MHYIALLNQEKEPNLVVIFKTDFECDLDLNVGPSITQQRLIWYVCCLWDMVFS